MAVSKALFYALSRSRALKRFASSYGMATDTSFARRWIAGETVEEAIAVARGLQARGLLLTLDYLGESVGAREGASAAVSEYLRLMDVVAAAGVERNVSLKLSQMGLAVDQATCVDNMRRILEPAQRLGFFVRIDMEDSSLTEVTLQIFETLWQQQYRNVGVVLQAYLYRTENDVRRMNELGARVRLVKGAYREPASIAYRTKADVNGAFARLMRILVDEGTYPAFATHDPTSLEETRKYAVERGVTNDRFEFQMLYGVRRDLQTTFVAQGYRMRVYVPFGTEWFPYFMRRLGERPANVGFVLRSLLHD
jgi:proline dehydrogenase